MRRYKVRWADRRNPSVEMEARVLLVDGYSSMGDIPSIIACRYLTQAESGFVAVLEVTRL